MDIFLRLHAIYHDSQFRKPFVSKENETKRKEASADVPFERKSVQSNHLKIIIFCPNAEVFDDPFLIFFVRKIKPQATHMRNIYMLQSVDVKFVK